MSFMVDTVASITIGSAQYVLNIELILQSTVIASGLALLLLTSGKVVIHSFKTIGIIPPHATTGDAVAADQDKLYGIILGKCENVIIYLLVFLEGYTALALIFTGKAIVRSEDKERVSVYHLAGTMINTAWSVLVAFAFKFLVGKIEILK